MLPVSVYAVLLLVHQPSMQAGLTGLVMASMNGHVDVARLLLESKADANLADQAPATRNHPKAFYPSETHSYTDIKRDLRQAFACKPRTSSSLRIHSLTSTHQQLTIIKARVSRHPIQ